MPIVDTKDTENFGDAITGVHSAIKQFVDAQKGDEGGTPAEGKENVKKQALKKMVKKASTKNA